MKNRFVSASLASLAAPLALFTLIAPAPAQSFGQPSPSAEVVYGNSVDSSSLAFLASPASLRDNSAEAYSMLPDPPEPMAGGGNPDRPNIVPPGDWHQAPFSRIGIGADVSPLGIGIKGAIVLSRTFDARMNGDFFNYNSARFDIEGFAVNADLHLASAGASLDWYPFNSIWRISPGLMFMNGNQLSMAADIAPGNSFSLNGQNFYSAKSNATTGATPLSATGVLGLHTTKPAFTIAGGFGHFVPHSNRHWSFPSEFGVAFTGAPTIDVGVSGWACTDYQETKCGDIGNPTNPVAIEFNNALSASLVKWRRDLAKVQVYPIFAYSVVYSFNIR